MPPQGTQQQRRQQEQEESFVDEEDSFFTKRVKPRIKIMISRKESVVRTMKRVQTEFLNFADKPEKDGDIMSPQGAQQQQRQQEQEESFVDEEDSFFTKRVKPSIKIMINRKESVARTMKRVQTDFLNFAEEPEKDGDIMSPQGTQQQRQQQEQEESFVDEEDSFFTKRVKPSIKIMINRKESVVRTMKRVQTEFLNFADEPEKDGDYDGDGDDEYYGLSKVEYHRRRRVLFQGSMCCCILFILSIVMGVLAFTDNEDKDLTAAEESPRPTTMFPPWPDTVPQSPAVVYSIDSGPLVGHTTHNSCKVWVYLGQATPMQLVYWPYSDGGYSLNSSQTVTLYPDAESNGAAIQTIQGLQANTLYLYEVRINNEWLSQGNFKTAPAPKQSTSFKYVLASCMNVKSNNGGYRDQPVWNEVMEKGVDFAILAGDNVYLDGNDWTFQGGMIYDRIWTRFKEQRAESNFARLIKSVPTYGTWDDHDYGWNNAEHLQPGKENSLQAWKHLWANPYQGSSKGPGNYYSYSWGDVDFFVLDCRWYRNSYNGTLIGDPQLEWLEEELIASIATFKIIVSASDIMEKGMTGDLQSLGRVIARNSISGVLFNSGDIHRNEYKVQEIENWPYSVHQLTSSGIARVWRRPFAIINVNTNLDDPEVNAEFYAADSSQRSATWSNDPNLICSRSQDENYQSRCTQRIRLSDLTP